jgi:hypothetical protein
MNGMDEMQKRENERLKDDPPPSLRELFLYNLLHHDSPIFTQADALRAFDKALEVVRNREWPVQEPAMNGNIDE